MLGIISDMSFMHDGVKDPYAGYKFGQYVRKTGLIIPFVSVSYTHLDVYKRQLTSDPTGFDYWNILIGQGDYYNPYFIDNGEKKQIEGYATNITTNLALDWLDNKRDKNKPFCLLLHHKAPHRTWMPDTCDLDLYEDVVYPVPETFYDKYEGRIAASEQEMNIIKDMDLVYDLKMADKENEIHTTTGLEENGRNLYNRMTPAQKAAWDKHYDPIIKKFKEQKLTGKALACLLYTSRDRT